MFVVSYTKKKRKYYESLDIKKFLDNNEFWKTVIFCLIKTQSVCKLALEKSKIVSDDFDFYDLSKEFRAFFKNANFCFCSIFIFNKKEPQICQFVTYRQNALFEFLTSQTEKMVFPIFKVIMR